MTAPKYTLNPLTGELVPVLPGPTGPAGDPWSTVLDLGSPSTDLGWLLDCGVPGDTGSALVFDCGGVTQP